MAARLALCAFVFIIGVALFTDRSLASCPFGWLLHGQSCYFFSADTLLWDIAQDKCMEYNGYLAELESKEESDYLEAISVRAGKSYWLGGKDDVTEGKWYWATSMKPFTYTDWSRGEPNDMIHNEDCLQLDGIRNRKWNDYFCLAKNNYICEKSFSSSSPVGRSIEKKERQLQD